MTISEKPGVYSSYQVTSSVTGSSAGKVVGLAALSDTVTADTRLELSSYLQAVSALGGDESITELCRLLFLNGAYKIVVITVDPSESDESDYSSAIGALCSDESVGLIVCDSGDSAVHESIRTAIDSAGENAKHKIGIVESENPESTAAALNSERMVVTGSSLVTGDTPYIGGSVAAALAGALAATIDPALPLNGAELLGLPGAFPAITENEITGLIRSGVTPMETVGGMNCVVRGVTSRTKTGGAADATWRDVTTTLIVDDVVTTIKEALRSRFSRSKNTTRARAAIRTQVLIELENKILREIIDSYGDVIVESDSDDPTVCVVSFDFTVAHGLNQIHITANITV